MRIVDMSKEPRAAQFEYFMSLPSPHVNITVNVDITHLYKTVKDKGYPFFLSLLHCAVNAANSIPEFRRRIKDGQVVEFEKCLSSHTVALENGSYCYCEIDCAKPFAEYLPYAMAKVAQAKENPILEDQVDTAQLYFVSSLPWLSFTSLQHPTTGPLDCNPRITFGKFFEQSGQILLPLNLVLHHALADGIHIARFYEVFDRLIAQFE